MSMDYIDMEKEIHKKVITFLKSVGGYARMKDFKEQGIWPKDISSALKQGAIEKIKPGLYKLSNINYPNNIPSGFIDVSKAVPNGIICLISALTYNDLTTFNPSSIYLAVPNNAYVPKIIYPPLEIFYFRKRFYNSGVDVIQTRFGKIKIYCKEKTICDMFRYRNKLGEDLALESLKSYISQRTADLYKLQEFAAICQVKTIMMPFIKALVNQNG
jgi:predicted transcriptional regulator of viral defense system